MTTNNKAALQAFTEKMANEAKQFVNEILGKDVFNPPHWKDIKTFEMVCEIAGENPDDYKILPNLSPRKAHSIKHAKVVLIYEVINGQWKPNWADSKQPKYEALRKFSAGSGFALDDVSYDYTYTIVGSRLCGESDEKVRHIETTFQAEINDYLLS